MIRDIFHNIIVQRDLENIYKSEGIDWNRLREKSVFLSGAYGMLASYMVYMLAYLKLKKQIDVDIVISGRSSEKAYQRFGSIMDAANILFFKWDVTSDISDNIPRCDYVIHAASPASGQSYSTNPVGTLLANIIGTKNTLEYARRSKTSSYLLFSSGEVYGRVESPFMGEKSYGSLDPTLVRNCYGEGKRAAECLCACWSKQYGMHVSYVRPSHTYGPTMDIDSDPRVFSSFVANALRGEDIVMTSDGSAMRSFCYIADATAAFFKVLLYGENAEAYNVACEKGQMSIADLAEMISRLSRNKVGIVRRERKEPYIENVVTLYPQQDVDKLSRLGYTCSTSPSEGFKRTLKSFELERI